MKAKKKRVSNSIHLGFIFRYVILAFALCLFTNTIQAQFYASCTHRTILKYDVNEGEFEYQNGFDENSMFKINTNLTMFEHTTPTMSSTYYASNSDYDKEEQTLSMEVVSDVGNVYLYVFDIKNDVVESYMNVREISIWSYSL